MLTNSLRNSKGVALIIALFVIVLVTGIINEITYETNVEYISNSQKLNQLQAYYGARAAVEISLLRIKIYNQIKTQYGEQLGSMGKSLDLIWSFPFAWPPVMPEDTSAVDKDLINKTVKESSMQAQYIVTIEDEGSKIDLNDLVSPSKVLRESAKRQLIGIFENKLKNDEDWAKNNRDLKYEELINSIADWMSTSASSLNGGDKKAAYSHLNSDIFPPNRSFRTLGELRMVSGMTDEIFKLLEPRVTIYGMKAINPNYANKEVIMSLDPTITEEVALEVIKRRDDQNLGGPFANAEDFWSFLNSKGARPSPEVEKDTPLVFDSVVNFKIKATGQYLKSTSSITAIVYDIDSSAAKIAGYLKKEVPEDKKEEEKSSGAGEDSTKKEQQAQGPDAEQNNKAKVSKGPPRIVYWDEK